MVINTRMSRDALAVVRRVATRTFTNSDEIRGVDSV
jgi:hypothetical protein